MNMSVIKKYNDLFKKVLKNEVIDPSSYFEYYTYLLLMENKALQNGGFIKSNQKIVDSKPISHAPAGPDIEVFGVNIAFICECSLKSGSMQFDDEHESVSRHYEKFFEENKSNYRDIVCFFIAPKISFEISEWFYCLRNEVKIIPIELDSFTSLMAKLSISNIDTYESQILDLASIVFSIDKHQDWVEKINEIVTKIEIE